MFLVDCPLCRCRHLCGAGDVREIGNLAPGVLAVVLACRCGGEVTVVTERASTMAVGRRATSRRRGGRRTIRGLTGDCPYLRGDAPYLRGGAACRENGRTGAYGPSGQAGS